MNNKGKEENYFYFIGLMPLYEEAELEVPQKSLELMKQDVWHFPIRVLRKDSFFYSISKDLESIRQGVYSFIQSVDDVLSTEQRGEFTKLQQIETFLKNQINDNPLIKIRSDIVPVEVNRSQQFIDELTSMSVLSEYINDSVLIGYELLLQRLSLVEKDIANDVVLLSEVERCLNEVRAAVLSSLSVAQGESDVIRHRFSVDLNHDIDVLQQQIDSLKSMSGTTLSLLQSDQDVGLIRLEKAKQSITELSEKIQYLMRKQSNTMNKEISAIDVAKSNEKDSQIDEF